MLKKAKKKNLKKSENFEEKKQIVAQKKCHFGQGNINELTRIFFRIKDISENVNIKITDIEGNLVAEAQSNTNLRYRGYNLEIDARN